MLAVDNSSSMSGGRWREAKRRPRSSSPAASTARSTGLIAFGHEALALTPPARLEADVARTLASLAPDAEIGTALYDAVVLSVGRLERMSNGARILVLLTDGRDRRSRRARSRRRSPPRSART